MSKISVLGDYMIDEYLFCSTDRISPEAPVLIAKINEKEISPGGAGNVAANMSFLGNETQALGLGGKNDFGEFEILFEKYFFDNVNVLIFPHYQKNIRKTRVVSDNHHLLRIDCEEDIYNGKDIINSLIREMKNFNPDFLIISDYDKGMISKIDIDFTASVFKSIQTEIIADIKPINFKILNQITKKSKRINTILPNEKEIRQSLPNKDWDLESYAKYWIDKDLCENVAITRGENGILFVTEKEKFSITSKTEEIADVCGCGDTVTSIYTHAISEGINKKSAIEIANECAALTAKKFGAYKVSKEEYSEIKENYLF